MSNDHSQLESNNHRDHYDSGTHAHEEAHARAHARAHAEGRAHAHEHAYAEGHAHAHEHMLLNGGRSLELVDVETAGVDLTTEAGLKRLRTIFEEQNISPDVPPDSSREQVWLSGNIDTFLKGGDETNGQYALFDIFIPPNAGPPTHLHTRGDEAFYIIDGEISFQVGNETFEGTPGDLIAYTRGEVHAFRNLGSEPARMLILAAPAEFEHFLREAGQPVTDPAAPVPSDDIAKVTAAGIKFGIELYPEALILGNVATHEGGITLYGDQRSEALVGSDAGDLIIGRGGNDQLYGAYGDDTIIGGNANDVVNGGEGRDLISGREGHDLLTGGADRDTFLIRRGAGTDTITDFFGLGTGSRPSSDVISKFDRLKFEGPELIARNMRLAQDGDNLQISFEGVEETGVILRNFDLENLENLGKKVNASLKVGNIVFAGEEASSDSFDIFNQDHQRNSIFNRNTVTFLNNLDNMTRGFDHSDDVINGQGGNDVLFGLSGDDLLRGEAGNDVLDGGENDDALLGGAGADSFVLRAGDGTDSILDFEDGFDSLLLENLLFSDLTISQESNGTYISLVNSNEALALLTGVDASSITTADFIVA